MQFSFTDGSPDGFCSVTVLCSDANSVCSNGICNCNNGFMNIDGQCLEGNYFTHTCFQSIAV